MGTTNRSTKGTILGTPTKQGTTRRKKKALKTYRFQGFVDYHYEITIFVKHYPPSYPT